MTDNVITVRQPDDGGPDDGGHDEFAQAVLDEVAEMVPELEDLIGTGQYWRIVLAREADGISELVEVRDDLVTALCAAHRRQSWLVLALWTLVLVVGIGALVALYYLAAHVIGVASTWDWAAAWQFVAHHASFMLSR